MRDYSYTPSASRVVSAKVVFRDTIPDFSSGEISDGNIAGWTSYDADEYNYGVMRVAVVGDHLAWQWIYYRSELVDEDYSWYVSDLEIKAGSKIGLFHNRLFFQGTDGHAYFTDIDIETGSYGAPVDLYTSTETLALAPADWEVVYACYLQSDHIKRIVRISGGSSELWSGAIYATNLDLSFDVGRSGNTDYILTSEDEGKRILYLTYANGIWSDTKYVFPLDVLDDTSYYKMCSISDLDGTFVLTSKVRRSNGPIMLTYSFGPEMYTAGREMFISEVTGDFPAAGKIHWIDGQICYLAPGTIYFSDATIIFGIDAEEKKHEVTAFSRLKVSQGDSGSDCQISLSNDAYIPAPGVDAQVYEIVDGNEYLLGTFDVNTVSNEIREAGKMNEVVGKGKATRRLSQWESDTSIDYWSQTKQVSTPADRGELARVSGVWDWQTDTLKLTDLNKEGYLSIVAKACRDGEMRMKFRSVAGDYHGRSGVGLQFYRLNVLEIAEILGKEAKDLTEEEADATGANGILALYGPVEDDGNPGVGLYKIRNGVLAQLAHAALTIPDDTDYWLMISSHDGYYKVEYREDASPTWVLALDYTYTDEDGVWKSGDLFDKVGRGFIYVSNDTPWADCYPFQATAELIPTKGHETLPAAGTALIDVEQISYTSKSANAILYGPYDYVGQKAIIENEGESGWWCDFAGNRDSNAIRVQLTEAEFYLRRAEVYVADVNDPSDGMKICIYTGPVAKNTPAGRLVASQVVPSSSITENFGWVGANFPQGVKVAPGDWLMLYRENSPTHPSGSAYYQTLILPTGSSQTFNEDTDRWSEVGGGFPYRIYGTPVGMGQMYGIEIEGGPEVGDHDLDDCVLFGLSGPGKNASLRIVGYAYGSPNSTVYVDHDTTSLFAEGSTLMICPSLTIHDRGVDDTTKTSHGETRINIYSEPQAILKNIQYFSSEPDITAGEMAIEICRKAGIEAVSRPDASVSGTISFGALNFSKYLAKRNFIVKLSGSFSDHRAGVFVADASGGAVVVWLDVTEASMYYFPDVDDSGMYLVREEYSIYETQGLTDVDAEARFSYNDGVISVWLGDRFIHSFVPVDTLDGTDVGVLSEDECTWQVDWEEADMRCDNFILDMGRKGSQLLMDLIGEKRIFFVDKPDGSLELFTSHEEVSGTVNLICESGDVETNEPVATRIRTEGGDVFEDITDGIKRHGNVFRLMNSRESNDYKDTVRFTELAIDEIEQRTNYNILVGTADPRIEAYDKINLINGKKALVDTVDYSFAITEEEVIFDMEVRSRWLEE